MPAPWRAAAGGRAAAFAALLAAQAVLAGLALAGSTVGGVVSPIWPAAGVAVAGLLLGGAALWPAVFAGTLIAQALVDPSRPAGVIVALAAADAAAALAGAVVLQRLGFDPALRRTRDAIALVFGGAPAAAVGAAALAALTLAVAGPPGARGAAPVFVDLLLAHYAGVLAIAPAVLAWRRWPDGRSARWWAHLAACIATAAGVAWLVFVADAVGLPLAWYTLLPLLWAALAFRMHGTPAIAVVAAIAIHGTTQGDGPFATDAIGPLRFLLLQQYLSVAAATMLLVGALARERDGQRAVREAEERLRLALAGVRAGTWELDLRADTATWSHEMHTLLGVPPADRARSFDDFLRLIHPDDRAAAVASFARACRAGGPFEQAFRVVRPSDGRVVWLSSVGAVVHDARGVAVRATGINQDITARTCAEHALQRSEARSREQLQLLDTVYQSAPVGLWLSDREHRYLRINHVLADFNGHPVQAHLGRTIREMVPGVAARLEPHLQRLFESGEPVLDIEVVGTTDARPRVERTWLVGIHPVRDAAGAVTAVSGVVTEVTERKRAQEALLDADRRKDEYLATLAHELRNPLAPIRTGLQVLARAPAGSAAGAEARAMMERQLRHMVRLIDDLLDVSRISRGQVELRRNPVALDTVLDQALEASRPAIDQGRQRLEVRRAGEPLVVDGDAARLTQVLGNLLHNAAKYTPPDGTIELGVYRSGDHAVIRVADTGVGIPAPMLGRVFEMFVQADTSRGGLGIGLSLVRQLVELHGGTVRADSDGPGRGSVFTVRLPLAPAAAGGPAVDAPGG